MVKSLILLLVAAAGFVASAPIAPDSSIWTVIAFDARKDGRDQSAPDAAQLSFRYDKANDVLWFRLSAFGRLDFEAVTVHLGIDTGDAAGKVRWPGVKNNDFSFDRLATITARRNGMQHAADIAVSSPGAANPEQRLSGDAIAGYARIDGDAVVIGIKRERLTAAKTMKIVASIGSTAEANDDIPNAGSAPIDLLAPRPARGLREIDTSRNNLVAADNRTAPADAMAPNVTQSGHGTIPLVLVSGLYSTRTAFDGFVARNASRFTFLTITPRGLNGTAPAPMPPVTTSYGDFTWTRMLAKDILDAIDARRLDKPIVVTHGFPGSLAVEELAMTHPGRIGGIVEIASMAVQPYPLGSGREATPDERVTLVDEAWARQWFKYVTPETWESNNYPREMFLNDPTAAERARQQVEEVSLPVKIRYLIEFMASDHRSSVATLTTPMLLMKPGFNDELLANPAFAWFKASFDEGWKRYPANPAVEFVTVAGARALLLDDQPGPADRAIIGFIDRIGKREE
jgi:pimeloyl-ACP methyl ester carboxylesterase